MGVRIVCWACGKRLKLPDGAPLPRTAKCPKCRAKVDLSAALAASVYLPTLSPEAAEANAVKAPASRPVPAPDPPGPPARTAPAPHPAAPRPTGGFRPPPAQQPEPLSLDDEGPLSLDDDPAPPAPPPPFRVPVRVLADSARQVAGPCFAVFVDHGVFLEVEALKPFLYIPVGCRADQPGPGELTVTLPDRRAITLRIAARYARPLARDAVGFLAGRRPAPAASEYRRAWLLLTALVLSLGAAAGPLGLSQTADLGLDFGLVLGAAFALVALIANAAVVLFARWSVPAQLAVMTVLCALVTGVFFFGATAYLAGRKRAEQVVTPPDPGPNTGARDTNPTPPPGPADPDPGPRRPPTHADKAYASGSSALEDGPAEVTALAISADANHLAVGYADGTTRVCAIDQPTFEPLLAGPKADGPVTRVQFDAASRFLFATTATGVVGAPRNGAPPAPARIVGPFVAVAPDVVNDRVRFAAVRGNLVAQRTIPAAFVSNPPKAKGFATVGPKDESAAASAPDTGKPNGPTFLAWAPTDKLLAAAPDGTITVWSAAMKVETVNRDHKAPVKAWAACAGTGDFATGDDKGTVLLWPYKGKPVAEPVFTAPVTGMSFAPSGARLAATDASGALAIVEVPTGKVIQRKKFPAPVKALAFGPNEDTLTIAAGKAAEVWWLRELMK